jgi:hypothetical protein
MALRGISILDLLGSVPGASLIPDDVADQLENLAILDHSSTTSGGAYVHYGTVRSVADMGLPALQSWPVEVPGLNEGLPFQLTFTRASPTAGSSLEAAPTEWRLDLLLNEVSIVIPDLKPAKPAGGSGVDALHLVADPARSRVRIFGSGVLRIASTVTSGGVIARFVDVPDTFDPAAPTGTVLTLGFDPASFLIGGTQFGLTVDRLTYDDAEDYTPPDIEARGHDATWRGISIKEATFYAPPNLPVLGDVSVGVRDVLLGSPFGLQGELRVEFGQTAFDPSDVLYWQQQNGSFVSMGAASGDAGSGFQVQFLPGTPATAQVRAQLSSGTADWTLPGADDALAFTNDSGPFEAGEGTVLRFRTHETAQDGSDALSPEIVAQFKHASSDSGAAPQISVTLAGSDKPNCLSLQGPSDKLAGLVLTAQPGTDPDLSWALGDGADASTASGATFTLPSLTAPYSDDLLLTDGSGRVRRLRVQVIESARFVAGCALSAYDENGDPLPLHGIDNTFELDIFHASGGLVWADTPATLSGTTVTVPQGELARMTLEASGDSSQPDSPPPAPGDPQRWIQVEMGFDDVTEYAWGEHRPDGSPTWSMDAVQAWVNAFPGADLVIIGRCCDLGTAAYNATLAQRRATTALELITVTSGGQIYARGEQTSFTDAGAQAAEAGTAWSGSFVDGSWLITQEHPEYTTWDQSNRDQPPRPAYRRVDIYVVGGTPASDAPTDSTDKQEQDPSQLRALIPGADPPTPTPPARREPTLPYRVLIDLKWDSPTAVGWGDAIPTLAELTIAWQPQPVPLGTSTGSNDDTLSVNHSDVNAPEIWTVKAHLSHDARTGQTLITASVEEQGGGPDAGIAEFDNTILAACLALGPALVAGIDAAGLDGTAVRLTALAAAGVFISVFADQGKVVVHKIQVEDRQDSFSSLTDARFKLAFDYTVSIGFDVDEGPIHLHTGEHPMKVKYKNVGLVWDTSKSGADRLSLSFDNVSFDIEDPGHWQIDGPLGELLRVVGSRAGSGSSWMEVDLRFAIDLGIVSVTGATIRVSFDNSGNISIELRGLQVSADVPGVLDGSGGLRLLPGGGVAANLDAELVPLDIEVSASIVIDMPEVALEMGVIFAVGIPLAQSGLGLFGFLGRFVVNGARHLDGNPDPIQQEIDWYHAPLADKYTPQQGAWALGLGAVVGTLPDTAFTFNALGSIAVSFPDPSVVFGIDAKFLGQPRLPSEDGDSNPPSTSLAILGLIAIDSTAVKLGIRGSYSIPDVLQLQVPINGYFPYPSSPGSAYLRIGADGVNGRTGPPVQLIVLPSTLNVQAWSYLMIEAHELHKLGGDASLNFDGFSVGFGAGFELKYGTDSIGLDLSAKVLIGVGTKPLTLAGEIEVHGELSLVVVSVSASGVVHLTITHDNQYLFGHFCGSVDCFFFSISGCIDVSFGNEPTLDIPTPDHPVLGVDLTNRRAVVTGAAALVGSNATVPTVWPDTVPVVHFAHYVGTELAAGSAFAPGQAAPGPVWSGSDELQYAFQLTGVDLLDSGGNLVPGPLDSGWWLPSFRPGVSTGTSPAPSAVEGRDLGLLSWNPAPWARNLIGGGEGTSGDPAGTLGSVCDPPPEAVRVCMDGQDAEPEGLGLVVMRSQPTGGPFPGYDELHGDGTVPPVGLEAVTAIVSEAGCALSPGTVAPLAVPPPGGAPASAFRLPMVTHFGDPLVTLPWIGRFATALVDPELTLAVCLSDRRTGEAKWQCSDLRGLKGQRLGSEVMWQSVTYGAVSGRLVMAPVGGLLVAAGLKCELPYAVAGVELELSGWRAPGVVRFFDTAGGLLGERPVAMQQTTVTFTGEGIQTVQIDAAPGDAKTAALVELCYEQAPHPATFAATLQNASFASAVGRGFPTVEGRHRETDPWVTWTPRLEARQAGADGECVYLVYDPPDSGPWWGFRIEPFFRFPLLLVSACGVTWTAAELQQGDGGNRTQLTGIVNGRTNSDGSTQPSQRPILTPGSTYSVRARCSWQGWRRTSPGATPPPPDPGAWQALPDVIYRFNTAAEPSPPPTTPVDFRDESTFDARATARYLIGFDPDGSGPPHFLDDTIEADFSVDYLPQLLALYGRNLDLRLRRTDQPPGALAGGGSPPNEPLSLQWTALPLELMDASDRRMTQAMEAAPCLTPAPLGGASAQITADLAPNADYDLMLVVPPAATPDSDEILIARAHFHTSRYANAREMLDALGLTADSTFPILPHDALLGSGVSVPTAPQPPGDATLEGLLVSLGMDPWPLPPDPRVVLIWTPGSVSGYDLAGALLEGDEPLLRPVDLGNVSASVGALTLAPVAVSTASTRVLLAAFPGPASVPGTDVLSVSLAASGSTWSGSRRQAGEPRMAYQETV